MTRVWLTRWEWDCCGDPFVTGDDIDFGIETREPGEALADTLGSEVVATVGAVESHHEVEYTDRLRGRVAAIFAVSQAAIERRSLRRPGHGAPPDAIMPAEGEEWPFRGRVIGEGVTAGFRPSKYVTEIIPVPASAVLTEVHGIRSSSASSTEPEEQSQTADDTSADPSADRRTRIFAGWLVDVEQSAT